ncbi:MAG: NAD(P)/FAD-dependent oxidoreductase [Bifidobacteriaceae bacterium]|jgi:phytoene dehydrogenase-like protein|nr:NAD(P)/FAD-dependent oxidoreductase [Bifidobacteriaceae bacterium]
MAQNEYDVIVVGAGHNGLTAAAYLAAAGLTTLVLEDQPTIGGNSVTRELTLPGFKHDVASTGFNFALANPAITDDELGLLSKYGFQPIMAPAPSLTNVFEDGTALGVYDDVDRTCADIAKFSPRDAKAYKEFQQYLAPLLSVIQAGMFNAPPKMGLMLNQLDQSPQGQELMKLLFMSAWELVSPWFEDPHTLIYLLNYPSEAMVDPEAGGSAVYILSMVASMHTLGVASAFPRGGIQSLPDSLAKAIEGSGGTILTGREVVRLIAPDGRVTGVETADGQVFTARKAVVSNVDPRLTLNQWLDGPLDPGLRARIDRIADPYFVGEMVHLALAKDPEFIGGDESTRRATLFGLLPADLGRLRQYFYDLRLGHVPRPERMLTILQHRADPSRAPAGKGVGYLWQFVPYRVDGSPPEKWDELRETVADGIVQRFLEFTTNLTEADILGRAVISPLDYERRNKNMVHGQVLGPLAAMFQYLSYRPVPELGQYRTPIDGLYLSGQALHPGGGLTMGGRATAQAVMADLGMDFDELF